MKQQGYQTNAEYIEAMMKQFKLVDMREQYRDLILEAESSSMDYESFLVRLLSVEEDGKRSRRTDKLKKEACFESEKRLEDIDYSFNQSLDKDKIIEQFPAQFIANLLSENFKENKGYYGTASYTGYTVKSNACSDHSGRCPGIPDKAWHGTQSGPGLSRPR